MVSLVRDYYTGDYFNNLTTITILPVRNDMSLMRFFAFAQNDENPRVGDCYVAP